VRSEENIALTTTTTTELLSALRQRGDGPVWTLFCERYRPLVSRFARKNFTLSDADAEDVAQDTLSAFHTAYRRGDYDRDRGRLRKWLFGIAANQVRTFLRKKYASKEVSSSSVSNLTGPAGAILDESVWERQWEEEWRQAIYQQCMVEVRRQFNAQTVEAFELFAKDGLSAQEVAEQLGMTTNAVYLAKQHILKRIRELLPYMEEAY
jgi:RNA polymerase sigma-70 factor (ECF subfamily)